MPAAEITRAETRARAELVSVQGYEIELDIAQGDQSRLRHCSLSQPAEGALHFEQRAANAKTALSGQDRTFLGPIRTTPLVLRPAHYQRSTISRA
jgi:hypothetical protein